MKRIPKISWLFALLALGLLNQGCVTTYKVGKKSFGTRAAAEEELAMQINQTLEGITPTTSPVGGSALVAIPTLEHIEQHGIKFTGNRAVISRNQIDFLKYAQMSARESMVTALKKRQIFDSVTLVHNDAPQFTSLADYDYFIYLYNPSPESAQWYIKSWQSETAEPIVMDMSQPAGLPRTLSWLDYIEKLVR